MGSVKIVGRNDGWLQTPTTFDIQVTEEGSTFVVRRRYSDFSKLAAALGNKFQDLPSMPPKSFVVMRLNPSFLDTRQQCLAELLDAAVAADPTIAAPALRSFLGLENDEWTDCSVLDSASSHDWSDFDSEDEQEHVATFIPGSLGITAHWESGMVSKVVHESRAFRQGVKVGMRFKTVDGKPYDENLLDKLIAGNSNYVVTFKCAEAPSPKALECALCLQRFQEQRALDCHMQFAHGWLSIDASETCWNC